MMRLRTFLVALTVATAGLLSPASALQPPPGVFYEITYYSSVSYATPIGQMREYCDGHYSGWGYMSEYSLEYYYDC